MTAAHSYHLMNSTMLIAIALFAVGVVGLATRRNSVAMFCSAAIMLQGVALALCAYGRFHGDWTGRSAGWIAIALTTLYGLVVAGVVIARFDHRNVGDTEFSSDKASDG